MHVEVAVQFLISVSETAAVYIDVHRQRMPAAQHRIVRQIQVEQMPSALPGFRIVATVRQVWNIFDHVDCVRCVPQFGTRGVNRDRAETHVENAADALFGKAFEIAVGFRPTFRMVDHLTGDAIFCRVLCAEFLNGLCARHRRRPFMMFMRLRPFRHRNAAPRYIVPVRYRKRYCDHPYSFTSRANLCNGTCVDFIAIATRRNHSRCIKKRFA